MITDRKQQSLTMSPRTPVELARWLVSLAEKHEAIAITYHVPALSGSYTDTRPFIFFLGEQKFSRHALPARHAEVLARCSDFVAKTGKSILLSRYLDEFSKIEPKLTDEVYGRAQDLGVQDQFMASVFGPNARSGVVSFAFREQLNWQRDQFLFELEAASLVFHVRMMRHFRSRRKDDILSKRENEVLVWIARGKTHSEIADILGVSVSSIDTYTRRIFQKMGVNDRVTAAVKGIRSGLLD